MADTPCPLCQEPLLDSDPDSHVETAEGQVVHGACLIRLIAGSVAHQDKRCPCFGGTGAERVEGMSDREDALAAWRFYIEVTSMQSD
jgi:hypothetical protein